MKEEFELIGWLISNTRKLFSSVIVNWRCFLWFCLSYDLGKRERVTECHCLFY